MRKFLFITIFLSYSLNIWAGEHAKTPRQVKWRFEGMLGTFDRQAIQRGFQVYKEVCASCHSLNLLAYRNLEEVGFSAAEVKAIAAEHSVDADPDDNGDVKPRPALPSDHFVSPYPNEQAARAANGGAHPPDLSLIIKAREGGANYTYSLLTGYQDPPANKQVGVGRYYNPYFPGGEISMPPPLKAGIVSYMDNTEASVEQMSKDVVNFLQWAAEPEMEHRKSMGIKVMLYLFLMTISLILAKKRIWERIEKK